MASNAKPNRFSLCALATAALGATFLLAVGDPPAVQAQTKSRLAPDTTSDGKGVPHVDVRLDTADGRKMACAEQAPQGFLVRKSWTGRERSDKENQAALRKAIDYRTEKYGRFPGFGDGSLNKYPPAHYAQKMTFMGRPLEVNARIVDALRCVEGALRATKVDAQYNPRAIGGMRFKNTYRGAEISNHVFGIAIDIEPDRNTCCNCVDPWPNHPLCKKAVSSIYERMAMPESWVIVFERYGFYWLGHDTLQDTMHFEFLGDPDKVLTATTAPTPSDGTPAGGAATSTSTSPLASQPSSTPACWLPVRGGCAQFAP